MIVRNVDPITRHDDSSTAVDPEGALSKTKIDVSLGIPVRTRQGEIVGVASLKELRELNAIVGRAALLREDRELKPLRSIELMQPVANPVRASFVCSARL